MSRLSNIAILSQCIRRFSLQSIAFQRGRMSRKPGFYAVRFGRQPGVYLTWAECENQVKGYSGASYKKFPSHASAVEFITGGSQVQSSNNTCGVLAVAPEIPPSIYAASIMPECLQPVPLGKSRKTKSAISPDKSEPPAKMVKLDPFEVPEGMVHVYTDGACTKNGRSGSKAGIGVYWGPDHPLNVSERLPGRQTNNRAEIQAAVRALQQAQCNGIKQITIYTDSIFLINSVTKWMKKWKHNGWTLVNGQAVINKEDFEDLEVAAAGLSVKWVHVRGHQGIAGNEAADHLAVQGLSQELDKECDE